MLVEVEWKFLTTYLGPERIFPPLYPLHCPAPYIPLDGALCTRTAYRLREETLMLPSASESDAYDPVRNKSHE